MSVRARATIVGAGLAALIACVLVLLTRPAALPRLADLHMPIPRAPLDRTLTIGSHPGVTVSDGTRLEIESRYGQFHGHWWWNKGWVYVSGQVLPGSRIHVHIDTESLAITETPDVQAVAQVRRYGTKAIIGDFLNVDVVRFGIGATLFATRTAGGPFPGRHVVDQLDGRTSSTRGLTITRDQVTSTPADHVPCTLMQDPATGWNLGCRLLGQRPLDSDLRGRLAGTVDANAISLTVTPNTRTQLPADSLRVGW